MERRRASRTPRVLIADDSADIREMWRVWLTFYGFEVDEAQNGLQAVQKARATQPDVVLMDIWMPVLDGLRATRQLKADASTARVPVLAMSAVPSMASEPVLAAGCEKFLLKPLHPDTLLAEIRAVLGRRSSEGGA